MDFSNDSPLVLEDLFNKILEHPNKSKMLPYTYTTLSMEKIPYSFDPKEHLDFHDNEDDDIIILKPTGETPFCEQCHVDLQMTLHGTPYIATKEELIKSKCNYILHHTVKLENITAQLFLLYLLLSQIIENYKPL